MRFHIEFPDGTYLEGEPCSENADLDGCFEFIDDEIGLCEVNGWMISDIEKID